MDGGEDYVVKDVTLASVAKSFPSLLTSQRLVRKKSTLVDFCSPNSRTALITKSPRQGIFLLCGWPVRRVVLSCLYSTLETAMLRRRCGVGRALKYCRFRGISSLSFSGCDPRIHRAVSRVLIVKWIAGSKSGNDRKKPYS